MRLHLRLVWRDMWVGLFVSDEHFYVCLLPCLVLVWDR